MFNKILIELPKHLESHEKIMVVIILIIISVILIQLSSFIIKKLTKRFDLEITFSYLIRDLIKYIIILFLVTFILGFVGINITNVIWSLGIIGISIGFAGRDAIANFISGIFVLADKTVKVGEKIEVNGVIGIVEKVGFRTTTLVTTEKDLVTVPNLILSKNPYINYTQIDKYKINVDILVPVYVDLMNLKKDLNDMYYNLDWIVKDLKPTIDSKGFEEEKIKITFSGWTNEYFERFEYKLILTNEIRKVLIKNTLKN